MQTQQPPLKACIYYDEGDREMVLLLGERLARDGVNITMRRDSSADECTADETYNIVRESDVLIFCVSTQFKKMEMRRKETRTALETILERRGRDTAVISIRLEDCNMPASLRKWQAVDLKGRHILRGGSWASPAEQITTFYRFSADPALSAAGG